MKSRPIMTLTLVLLLAGCSATTQTTSGRNFLERYGDVVDKDTTKSGSINDAIVAAASVEPVLRFPARIGLARLDKFGHLSAIPEAEAVHWKALLERLGDGFGQFVPVDPMISKLATGAVDRKLLGSMTPVDHVRLAAARQHLDAVMLYQVSTVDEYRNNALSGLDFTLISAFLLPSRSVKSEAVGAALLIDVIQGYPYASLQTSATESDIATWYGAEDRAGRMQDRLRVTVTAQLTEEAETALNRLYRELDQLDRGARSEP